jgi:ABC-2 type transport system permease protein
MPRRPNVMASPAMTDTASAALPPTSRLIIYRPPQGTVTWFVGVRALRLGAVAGVALGVYVLATAVGYRLIAPTAAQRAEVLNNLAASTGLRVLLGQAARITSAAGFVDWRVTGVAAIVGPVCWLIVATRTLRGEEASGRWELVLAGRTTPGRATAAALAGLGLGVLTMYLAVAVLTKVAGRSPGVHVGAGQALLFGLAVVAPAAEFLAIGAVASQVMPTRARAAALAAGAFGASFLLRAAGDAAPSAHFLVYASPLGWVEQLHSLGRPQALWLVPIAALIIACIWITLVLAARRDLGASLLADSDAAEPRTALLGSPIRIAIRLSWQATARWLAVIVVAGVLYGALARSAGQAFATSASLQRISGVLMHAAQRDLISTGARAYAGIIFLLLATLLMAYAASAVGRLREDEAEGYLDNLVVRPVSRQRWLTGRVALMLTVMVLAAMTGGIVFWIAAAAENTGLTIGQLTQAGLNSAAPAIVLSGLGVLLLGFVPRLVTVACWAIVAWAFMLDLLGAVIPINHWLMDTSLLQHLAPAPAVNPDWRICLTYLIIGVTAAVAGGWRFTRRDLRGH